VSSSQIKLSWSASTDPSTGSGQATGVTGYRIYRDGTQIANTVNTTYQDTGLSPSTTYTYTVSAYDAAGNESSQSNQASAITQPQPAQSNNLALNITPSVDSTYSGYTTASLTDGTIDPYGGTSSTWASAESSTNPHWITIDFGQERIVGR